MYLDKSTSQGTTYFPPFQFWPFFLTRATFKIIGTSLVASNHMSKFHNKSVNYYSS
jgi:hypothetical protein